MANDMIERRRVNEANNSVEILQNTEQSHRGKDHTASGNCRFIQKILKHQKGTILISAIVTEVGCYRVQGTVAKMIDRLTAKR